MRLPRLYITLYLASAMWIAAAEDFQYFPVSLENTTLADGTALKIATVPATPEEITRSAMPAQPNNHWHWRDNVGSGNADSRGILTSAGNRGHDAPMLRTTVAGLKPKTNYQVFGCFWISGYATDTSTPNGNSLWDIRLGCGISEMMGYGFKRATGYPVSIECEKNAPWKGGLRDKDGDKRLFSANLGIVRTDANGTLIVYVDDQPDDAHEARTWYDGIGVLPATTEAKIGAGAPRALHRAVRCSDWEMVRRELEAGAEINALDLDGLTPLFYACVDPDLKQIDALLKAGASPDAEGQSLSPLWVVATAGRADLTDLLLKAGAKIPLDPLPADPRRKKFNITARAHPAVAAIFSGSTQVLKLLLDKEPELDIDRLFSSDFDPLIHNRNRGHPYAVLNAVALNHPEMAEYLIKLGCQIKGPEYFEGVPKRAHRNPLAENSIGSRALLVAAVSSGPAMHGVVTALSRRGVPLVDDDFIERDFIVPWDALSAAALSGDVVLTKQLLPSTGEVGKSYKTSLIALAHAGGNEEVIKLVGNRFSDVTIPRWDAKTVSRKETRITDDARVFQLRKVPFKPRNQPEGKKVLAVISDPESAGPAAAITANASATEGWICVEREQIESLLQESRIAKPWDDVAQDLSSLGDRISADLLIIVSRLKSDEITLLRIEAIDVRSGLPIDRIHLDEKGFQPKLFCENYLADIRIKLEERLAGKMLTAITLLPITVDEKLGMSRISEGVFRAGLLQEIDQTPGMIALTRDQMQPLAEEKILGQTGKLWGAAWTIEGGLRPLDGNQVELTLRIRSLGKDGESRDVKASGSADAPQSLVKAVWKQIPAIMMGDPAASNALGAEASEKRASTEAARLLREAEWLNNINRGYDAAALIDAALYLGADPLKTNLLRMNIHMSMRNYLVWGQQWSSSSRKLQPIPVKPLSTLFADEAAYYLEEYMELLRINSESFNRVENLMVDQANNQTLKGPLYDFLWNLETLVYYRSILYPGLMASEKASLLKEFDVELEAHIKRLFSNIKPTKQGRNLLLNNDQYNYFHLKAVPALADVLAETIVRIFDCSHIGKNYARQIFMKFIDESELQDARRLLPDRAGIMCDSLEKATIKYNSPLRDLRLAEIKFIRSFGEKRTIAARELLHMRASMLSTEHKIFSEWYPSFNLYYWSPMLRNDYFYLYADLHHGDSLIPSLLYTSKITPDQVLRQTEYTVVAAGLAGKKISSDASYSFQEWQLAEDLELRMNRLAEKNESASEFDGLLSSAHLIDRLAGVDVARKLEPKITRLKPKESRKNFGSKNQFPMHDFEGALHGKLLIDLRSGITDKAAMFTHPMVDPKNRNILWLILNPYTEPDFKLNQPFVKGTSCPQFVVEQPWMLAIDCREGKVIHKINLAKAAGFPEATSYSTTIGGNGGLFYNGIHSNDNHFLVHMNWWRVGERYHSALSTLLINRETGAVEKLAEPLPFHSIQFPNHGSPYNGAVGVGDSFYIVQRMEPEGTMLWRVKPGEKPVVLAQSGRRPEQSPFDAKDRQIHYIAEADGKLLAASSWSHFGRYDAQTNKWTTDPERSEGDGKSIVDNNLRKELHATLFPQHLFKHDNGSIDAFASPIKSQSGQLIFQNGAGPQYYLPVQMKIPDYYQTRFQVFTETRRGSGDVLDELRYFDYEWISVSDLAASLFTKPGIINQTDTHFVISTHIDFKVSKHINDGCFLPFLWSIDKSTMLQGMEEAKKRNSN